MSKTERNYIASDYVKGRKVVIEIIVKSNGVDDKSSFDVVVDAVDRMYQSKAWEMYAGNNNKP